MYGLQSPVPCEANRLFAGSDHGREVCQVMEGGEDAFERRYQAWEKMSYMFEMTDNLHCFIEILVTTKCMSFC